MGALTFKHRLQEPAQKIRPVSKASLRKMGMSVSSSSPGYTALQRKPICPCGGGCPRCVPAIQPKMKVGAPDDVYEREADRVAEQVMRLPQALVQKQPEEEEEEEMLETKPLNISPLIQRQTEEEEEEEEEPIQTKRAGRPTPLVSSGLESRISSMKGKGQRLPDATRSFFEPRFGYDFSRVRVHTDSKASETAQVLNARAFTVGHDITFGAGQYSLGAAEGKKLLAHELTHVVQQTTIPQMPWLQAYGPRSGDPIHEPIVEEYRQRHPSPELDYPTPGEIKYQLEPITIWTTVLNTERRSSTDYQRVLQAWPNGKQIWPYLHSRNARIEFIKYLLEFDRTNCRPYDPTHPGQEPGCDTFVRNHETFRNLCQGYATQLHVRFRARPGPPDATQIERLRTQARIYYQAIDPKFRIPILIAHVPGHAFNAILVGQTPSSIDSYLFVEPQTDSLFEPSSSEFGHNFRIGLLTLSELREFNERGQYVETTRRVFIRDPFGRTFEAKLSTSERMSLHRVYAAIFIADDDMDTWRETIEARGTTYENNVRDAVAGLSDEDLLLAARYVIGRFFRRSPGGIQERLTIDAFIKLVNRESLRERLQRQQQSIPKPAQESATPPGTAPA